jgi:hypothetical protein
MFSSNAYTGQLKNRGSKLSHRVTFPFVVEPGALGTPS